MSSDPTSLLRDAAARMRGPKLRKLLDPGLPRFVLRALARARRRAESRRVRLFFGADMEIVLPEVISEAIYTYGFFDEAVTAAVLHHVKAGDVVLDVGAHFGYFSLLFAHLVGTAGRVHSFEPTPSTFEVLSRNVAGHPRVVAVNAAAGRTAGRLQISDFGLVHSAWNTLSEGSRIAPGTAAVVPDRREVAVLRLDEHVEVHGLVPSFVKIDAENFEAEVVGGLSRTIEAHRPKLVLEVGSSGGLEAATWLASLGYRMFGAVGPGAAVAVETPAEANERFKDVLFLPGPGRA